MWVAKTVIQLLQYRKMLKGQVVLVPTMGALHHGHLSLIDAAKQAGDHVIVSIFVNPTQFGPSEDYDGYPRRLDEDLTACKIQGAAGAFCPSVSEMYPPSATACELTVPTLSHQLEGQQRPNHFAGVCRVVAKLFNIVQPHTAVFGQKDYQQFKIIQTMVDDLAMPIHILGCPTVRQPDGLAISSRNMYLNGEQRRHAVGLYKALNEAKVLIENDGESDPTVVENAMRAVLAAHHVQIDYAALRHPDTLAEMDCISPQLTGGVVALVAGRIDGVRLIDNMVLGVFEHLLNVRQCNNQRV